MPRAGPWLLYLLRCGDGTFYCGVTNDLPKRLAAHASGKGARYTRGRGPLRVVYREACADRSAAQRREHAVKRLSRAEKSALIRAAKRSKTSRATQARAAPAKKATRASAAAPGAKRQPRAAPPKRSVKRSATSSPLRSRD